MELPHFGVFGLLDDAARDVELGGLHVEVEGGDGGHEIHVDASGGGGARGGFGGDAAEGGGAQEIALADEVVGEPHVFWFFRVEGDGAGAIALDVLLDETHRGMRLRQWNERGEQGSCSTKSRNETKNVEP